MCKGLVYIRVNLRVRSSTVIWAQQLFRKLHTIYEYNYIYQYSIISTFCGPRHHDCTWMYSVKPNHKWNYLNNFCDPVSIQEGCIFEHLSTKTAIFASISLTGPRRLVSSFLRRFSWASLWLSWRCRTSLNSISSPCISATFQVKHGRLCFSYIEINIKLIG